MTHAEQDETDGKPGHGARELHVKVLAPRSTEPKRFTWDKDMLVADAAAEAAQAFGYTGGTPGLSKGRKMLEPTEQLHQAGVHDGDTLELLDRGGGV
jgi:hypothetical protein